jgi:polyhydroxyalkanoate synthesis regulator phasin
MIAPFALAKQRIARMKTYRDLAREFVDTLRRENAESQKQIDQIKTTGMRIGQRPSGGSWSDVTDQEVASLKDEISSRERTIAGLEQELRAL